MLANLPFVIGFAFDALILLLFWIWSRKPRKKPRYKPKSPAIEYEVKGSGNIQGKGHTVNYHPPTREMSEMEKALKETIDILALQMNVKQKNIEELQNQCKYKEEWVKYWKERYEACELKYEQLLQAQKHQKRKLKAKNSVPYIEMGDLKERLQELYA